MSTEFVIFAPFLAFVTLMLVAFGVVHYLAIVRYFDNRDNRP